MFAALCVIGMTAAFDLLLYVSGRDIVPPFQVEAYQSAKEAGWLLWLAVAIVFAAPIGEEIAFRGFLYRGLARPGREMLAIVVIALAWALLHIQYDWLGMAQIFTAGLMLGWFRWASGSTTFSHHHACSDQLHSDDRNRDQDGMAVMSAPDPQALGARAEAMIAELGAISAEPGRLVRLFLTPEHRRAADLVAGWMRAAGLVGERGRARHRARAASAMRSGGC